MHPNKKTIAALAKPSTTPGNKTWEPHPGYETGNTEYCWAHGYKLRKGHTGAICKAREFGDNDTKRTATRSNTKGGTQANTLG